MAAIDDLLASLSARPSAAEISIFETFMESLRTAKVWGRLDWVHLAGSTSEISRTNLVMPRQRALLVNAPTFTAKRGFTGNGSSAYLNTGKKPLSTTSSILRYQMMRNSLFLYSLTSASGASVDCGDSGGFTSWLNANSSGSCLGASNVAVNISQATTDGLGYRAVSRSDRVNGSVTVNATTTLKTTLTAPSSLGTGTMCLLRGGTQYSSRQILGFGFGDYFNAAEHLAIRNAFEAANTALLALP